MTNTIAQLFASDVTRDIPPVVYFHEQDPAKLRDEVSEYIVTGGWPDGHPHQRRVPSGIHEQYVRLLTAIASELDKNGGPELPSSWISGFYGSGKSSFAKLLGLSLDGALLPDSTPLADALLRRDVSPRSAELREAWAALRGKIEPIAVVFDIGGVARDNEQIHSAVVRQLQKRLGYCSTEPLVAEFELKLERDGHWGRFEETALEVLGQPWTLVKDKALAEEEFSLVMSRLDPAKYTDPMSWYTSRAGTFTRSDSASEVTRAIADMLRFRAPDKTLFLVIDEVSQYIHQDHNRMLALQSFVSELGQRMKGRVWLLVTGQEKLEEAGDSVVLSKMKDRFPPRLRVHLAATNIRDVVHKRLLQKTPEAEAQLRALFQKHRQDLKLFAYGCESVTEDDFVDVYPMLPGHIDLLLQITSALRTRSTRSQGDDQAIRGLLQLLGELFREKKLADLPVGALVTFDHIYDVQQTALDSDIQASMARILSSCAESDPGKAALLVRAAKAVALLELVQDVMATDARLVAACLFDSLDAGNRVSVVTEALEDLRRRNLLSYSEKHGYKIQSTAGEEWERERRDIGVPRERISERVQEALKHLLAIPEQPRHQGRPFPWAGVFSDGRGADEVSLQAPRDEATVMVDFRFLTAGEQDKATWVKRSAETQLGNRLVWVCGDTQQAEHLARELGRSLSMVSKYRPRRESLNAARKLLLQQEENRAEELVGMARDAVGAAWMSGRLYFRGRELAPGELGSAFAPALHAAGSRVLPDLFPHFEPIVISPTELMQLVEANLTAPTPKYLPEGLGILELDAGRYVPSCNGVVPQRVLSFIEDQQGVSGSVLLSHLAGPPFGYTRDVVRACVAGLLRGGKLRIQPDGGSEITATRDAGVRDLFQRDRTFLRANVFPAGDDDVSFPDRARICRFFDEQLGHKMDREDHAIADAVAALFPSQLERLRSVLSRLNQLPESPPTPEALAKLERAFEDCIRVMRQTKPTVRAVRKHLDALRDGMQRVSMYDTELTGEAIQAVRTAANVRSYAAAQLRAVKALDEASEQAVQQIEEQLAGECAWRGIDGVKGAIEVVRQAYIAKRQSLLNQQEALSNGARESVKRRAGFEKLDADGSHKVLRPIALAANDTTAEAVAPTLEALVDPFSARLRRATEEANEILDQFLEELTAETIVTVRLGLHNRELRSKADVDGLLDELRAVLEAKLTDGVTVRIL